MFSKVLIANRGEIAVRVMRACRELGIPTVCVYVPGEEGGGHVRVADEAVCLPDRRDYLNIDRLISVALASKVDAIHPGYGFLSENPAFVQACERAGLTFIGPRPQAMERMGIKTAARQLAEQIGVPVLPGSPALSDQDEGWAYASRIGFPVLVKASYGGGGRGIRPVLNQPDLEAALAAAGRESEIAFGNAAVYIEKYLARPRHVEVQVICDGHGNRAALGERECSIQRRRQKLVEEGPSPAVDPATRQRLQEAALRLAEATDYLGAGTVEFLLGDKGQFYFLEMNTRIQVEHGVTELLTGIDLVKEQVRIACGERLDLRPRHGELEGWAMECRVVAEDPAKQFRPSPGEIRGLQVPHGPWVRWDSDLYLGAKVTPMFDSLVGKLLVWGRDRAEAIARMRRALGELQIEGIVTSAPLMRAIMADADFVAGRTHVHYLEEKLDSLLGKERLT